MARQAGDTRITGTIDEFCFYKMDGEYYVRKKSRLTEKRFWKDEAFEGSRKSCSRFAEGNKIASKVYRMVDEEKRVYQLFCFLKKRAIALLKDGMKREGVEKVLVDYLVDFGILKKKVSEDTRPAENVSSYLLPGTKLCSADSVFEMFYDGRGNLTIRQFFNSTIPRGGTSWCSQPMLAVSARLTVSAFPLCVASKVSQHIV